MLRKVLDRENVVKQNLIKRLIDCVKELQFKIAADKGAPLVNDEATNLLCWILEAIFIHGLKNPFLKSVTSVFNSKENVIPEPSFWEFLLIFCHQDVIVQINKLSFISTDVGRCRAWLRLALNDGLFISYLQMMLNEKSSLKNYYKPSAFLRDPETCDILKSYLYGVESYDFQLAYGSSLLNAWNSGPLSLVGLWTASNPNESISEGVDVAENMDADVLQVLPSLQSGRNSSSRTRLPSFVPQMRINPLLHEDEAIRVILSSSKPTYPSNPVSRRSNDSDSGSPPPNERLASSTTPNEKGSRSDAMHPTNTSNQQQTDAKEISNVDPEVKIDHSTVEQLKPQDISISTSSLETKDDLSGTRRSKTPPTTSSSHGSVHHESGQQPTLTEVDLRSGIDIHQGNSVEAPRNEEKSYMDLLNTYNQNHQMGTPITDSFLDSIFPRSATSTSLSGEENRNHTPASPVPVEQLGFEVLSIISSSGHFSEMQKSVSQDDMLLTRAPDELPQVNSFLQTIPQEVGMDSQNYRCKFCDRPIGMLYGPAKLCALSGNYFCQECGGSDESVIPARILLNWDFGRYSVSKQGKLFLQDIHEKPLFDLVKINHRIYNEVEECEEVRVLRAKLQSISLYLRTCKEPVMDEITKDIWPKPHLYKEVHLYSVSDLLSIPNRNLASGLTKLLNYGKTHIFSCSVCQQKGFVCEVCKDPKVIFPFEFETNFKCSACGAVYHSSCMNSKEACPRCERWSWKISAADEDLNSSL